ncbi:MAG: tetratricopeptide repeat-containing sensor histidine kinase [Bacteroidales bacterium]|nr:tetratricopeptide repeat-containing sensor histidine kinase [Bacteroidales bacterium]
MKRSYILIQVLLIVFCNNAIANKHDSLINVLTSSEIKKDRIDAYLELTKFMLAKELDSANKMIDSVLRWSQRENYKNGIATGYNFHGEYLWRKGSIDSAIGYFHKTVKYSIQNELTSKRILALANIGSAYNDFGEHDSAYKYLNQSMELAIQSSDLKLVANASDQLGKLYRKYGNYEKALECFFESRKIYEESHDSVKLVNLFNSFGSIYQDIGDFEKSLEFFKMSMELDLIVDEVNIIYHILNNLGVLYWQVALEYDSARHYILSSLEILPKTIDPTNKQIAYINLGGIETDDDKHEKALDYYRKAQSVEILYPSLYIQSALFINMGIAFNGLGQYDSAKYYSFRGLKIAKETNTKMWIKNAYNTLYMVDSAENRLDSAMYYLSKYHAYQDSLSREELDGKISELEIRYETEKKEIENQELKKENTLNEKLIKNQNLVIIIGVFAFIFFILYLISVLSSRKTQKKKNIELADFNKKILSQQQQLEKANKKLEFQKKQLSELIITKDKFFSIVAHDLRSPFNVILGFLDLLEQEFDLMSDSEKIKIIQTLQKSSQNTYQLLINLLDWARSQRGMIKNDPKKINLSEILENAIKTLHESSKKKEQNIHNEILKNTFVIADKELLNTIFRNLLNNSIKFTPKKGDIYINVNEKGKFLEICIKDTGIGIPEDKIPMLFNIDCDYNLPGTDRESGTGLGLIIVREFVELMGSSINVESELGKGSKFCFMLPMA